MIKFRNLKSHSGLFVNDQADIWVDQIEVRYSNQGAKIQKHGSVSLWIAR